MFSVRIQVPMWTKLKDNVIFLCKEIKRVDANANPCFVDWYYWLVIHAIIFPRIFENIFLQIVIFQRRKCSQQQPRLQIRDKYLWQSTLIVCYFSTDAEKAIFRSTFVAKKRQIPTRILREREEIPLKRPTKASDLPSKLPKHRKERGL